MFMNWVETTGTAVSDDRFFLSTFSLARVRQVDGLKREIVLLQKAKEDADGASKQELERLQALCAEQEEKLLAVSQISMHALLELLALVSVH